MAGFWFAKYVVASYNDATMTTSLKRFLFPIAVCVIVLLSVFWWMQSRSSVFPSKAPQGTFQSTVDRGMTPEVEVFLTEKIATLEAQLASKQEAGEPVIQTLLELANAHYAIGELGKAVSYYNQILAISPRDVAALENLGQTYKEGNDPIMAEATWRQALAFDDNEITYLRLAELITVSFPDRVQEVGPLLEGAIAKKGQTPGYLVALGNWYKNQGMLEEAISHYEVAYRLDTTDKSIKNEIELLQAQLNQERQNAL